MTTNAPPPPAPAPVPVKDQNAESVIIRPWPKVVFLYPTFFAAVLCFPLHLLGVDPRILGNSFTALMCLNLLVFSFDFSRIKSITIVIGAVAVGLMLLLADSKWQIMGPIGRILGDIDIPLPAPFYGFFGAFLGFLFLIVFVNSRFNYYEINPREILHHHGYLGDITRWSTDGLEMNKEIYDMAEYLLLRSGRLILQPASSRKAIVIDNVMSVNRIEVRVNDLLSVMAVRFNQRPGPG